jgi:hypothetical protein
VTRLTPFDHVFADLAAARFPAIRDEARARSADTSDLGRFAALPTAQRLLADLESPDLVAEHPEAAEHYVAALFVAYRFWDTGCRSTVVDRVALARVIERTPSAPSAALPEARYLQLPERWFWGQIDPAAPHEPVDGLFIVCGRGGQEVTVLAVLGLRPDRAGFSQVAVRATPDEVRAARTHHRTPPFAPVIEGGAAAGIRSVVSDAELLALAGMAWEAAGGGVAAREAGGPEDALE